MPVDLGSLTARIGLDSTPLIAGAAAARGELSGLEASGGGSLQRLSDIGRTAFLALGASAAVIGAASLKAASDFQASMELVRTQAGASQGELDSMTSAILRMASSVGTAPEQLAQALFHIESAGYRGATALDILRIAAEGAKVGQADLESVTNALIAVEVSHIKGVGSVSDAMGVLNAIVGVGNVRMGDLAAAMGTGILSAAANFGLSLQDVGGALAVLTDNAVPADEAATRLRMTFSLMAAPTGVAQKALASIGLTQFQLAEDMRHGGLIEAIGDLKTHLEQSGLTATEQAAVLTQAFGGGRTSAAIITLVEQFDRLKQKIGDVGAGAGTFGSSWEATKETFKFQMDQMKAAVDVLAIRIGTVLIPIVTKMAVAVADAVKWLTQHKDVALALAAAIGGPLLVAMTAFVAEEVIALAPILAVAAAIAALSGGFVYAYEKIGPFHDAIDAVGKFLQSTFLAAVAGAKQAWDGFITGFQNPEQRINVGGIQGVFQGLGANLRVVFADIKAGWDLFLLGFSNPNIDVSGPEGVIVGFGQTVKTVLSGLSGVWNNFVQYIRDIAPQVQEAVGHIAAVIKAQLDLIAGVFAAVFATLSAAWRQWGDDVMRIVRIVFDTVKAYIDSAIRAVRDIINGVLALINGDWGKAWAAFSDIPKAAFDLIKTLVGNAMKIIGDLFATGWNAISQAVPAAFGVMLDFFKALPGRITGAMGSLPGVLKAAGTDLITGFYDGVFAKAGQLFDFFRNLPRTIEGLIGNALTWLKQDGIDTLQGFITGLIEKAKDVTQWIATELPKKIADGTATAVDWLKDAAPKIIDGLIVAIKAVMSNPGTVAKIAGAIVGGLALAAIALPAAGAILAGAIVLGIVEGLAKEVGRLTKWIATELPGALQSAASGAGSWLVSAGSSVMTGLWNGLRTGLSTIIGWAGGFASTIGGWFSGAVSWLFNAGSDVLLGLWNGLRTGLQIIINWGAGFPATIGAFFIGAGSWLYNVGIDLMTGFLNGIIRVLDFLPSAVQKFLGLDDVIRGLRSAVDTLNGAKIDITANADTAQAQQALDDLLATMGGIVDYSHPPPGNQGPAFAMGGVTAGPSLAGEAGPELILPLTHLQRARQLLREQGGAITGASGGSAGAMGSSVTNYNLYGPVVASDPAELERQLEAKARVAALAGRN